jgi:hypothetical protein
MAGTMRLSAFICWMAFTSACAHVAASDGKPEWASWASPAKVHEPTDEERIDVEMSYEEFGPSTPGADGIALVEMPSGVVLEDAPWQRYIPPDRGPAGPPGSGGSGGRAPHSTPSSTAPAH